MSNNFYTDDFSFKSFNNSVQNNEMSLRRELEDESSPKWSRKHYNDSNKVFVGGLNHQTDEKTFEEYFSKYGKLEDFVIIKDAQSGRSRGFGFVQYSEPKSVDDLMKDRPHSLDQHTLDIKRSVPRNESQSEDLKAKITKLYVSGFQDRLSEDELRGYFSQFGNVLNIEMPKDKETNSKPRGFAFVHFDDYDSVDKIVLGKNHCLNGIRLNVKKAIPKEQILNRQQMVNRPNMPMQSPVHFLDLMKTSFQQGMFQNSLVNNFSLNKENQGLVSIDRGYDAGYSPNTNNIPNYHLANSTFRGPIRNKKFVRQYNTPYQQRPAKY